MISSLIPPYCPDCPRRYRPIHGSGPLLCPILVIGERPGQTEQKYQRVFIGKTGKEFDETYLPLANLSRCDVRVVNCVACFADNNRTPTPREIASCSKCYLPAEFDQCRPEIIILMGGSACSLVPSIRLEYEHGIPRTASIFSWTGTVVPMYHPALGLHESRWMTQLLEDWSALPGLLSRVESTRPHYQTNYRLLRGKEVNDIELSSVVATDTESHGSAVFSVQVSSLPGSAYMVLAKDREGIALLDRRLRSVQGIFHYGVHDLDELQRMGLSVKSFRDTLQEAFHLGNLPQALKPLVYRLFGFWMTSWEDVVRPYSIEALTIWLIEALEIAQADLALVEVKRLKTKLKETIKKSPVESLILRLISHTSPHSDYDPWKRLDEFWRDDANSYSISHLDARCGSYPILGIGNAPLARAVTYACGDADWTGQVATELARRRNDSYWRIENDDCDN
jgi:uracil-DNA glycosylase family 4